MEIFKLEYPNEKEGYLKDLFIKEVSTDMQLRAGTVILKKGEILPPKTFPWQEISLLVSGTCIVTDTEGTERTMKGGEFIFIEDKEIRKTECIEECKIVFFLARITPDN